MTGKMMREMTSMRLEREGNLEIHERQQDLVVDPPRWTAKWKSHGRALSNGTQSLVRSRDNGFLDPREI
jgi:hypothetical protein